MTWGAAQLGSGRASWTSSPRGGACRADDVVVLAVVWIDPGAGDETALKRSAREAMRTAIADALRPRRREPARRAPRAGRERLLHAVTDLRIAAVEVRRYARRPRPAVQGGVGPGSPRPDRRQPGDRPLRGRARGLRERRRPARRRAARAPARGARPAAHGGRPGALRDRRPTRRPAVDRRGGDLGSGRPGGRRTAVAAARRAQRAAARLRVERRAGRSRRACPPRGGAARCRRAGDEDPLPPRRLAQGRRGRRGGARRGRPRCRADGRRQPGLADGGRSHRALGRADRGAVRAGARAARRPLARGAAAHRRRRGLCGAEAPDVAAHRGRGDGARACSRPATSSSGAAST